MQGQHDPCLGSDSTKSDPEMNVHVQSRSKKVLPGENSKEKEDWKKRKLSSCVFSEDVAPAWSHRESISHLGLCHLEAKELSFHIPVQFLF